MATIYTNHNHIKDHKARMQLIWAKTMAAMTNTLHMSRVRLERKPNA